MSKLIVASKYITKLRFIYTEHQIHDPIDSIADELFQTILYELILPHFRRQLPRW